MILVVDFMGNAIKSFQEPLASVLVPFCIYDRFTREFSECSQESLFSSGRNYLWLKTNCVFSEVNWFLPTLREFW